MPHPERKLGVTADDRNATTGAGEHVQSVRLGAARRVGVRVIGDDVAGGVVDDDEAGRLLDGDVRPLRIR